MTQARQDAERAREVLAFFTQHTSPASLKVGDLVYLRQVLDEGRASLRFAAKKLGVDLEGLKNVFLARGLVAPVDL